MSILEQDTIPHQKWLSFFGLWLLHYHHGAVRVVGAVVAHAPKKCPAEFRRNPSPLASSSSAEIKPAESREKKSNEFITS
jgi:hypothetical protein